MFFIYISSILSTDCSIDPSKNLGDGLNCIGSGSGTITLKSGTYSIDSWRDIGSWNDKHTGTLTIRGEGNVIINGGFKITGWTKDTENPNILTAQISQTIDCNGCDNDSKVTSWRFESLWVNDHDTHRARIPSSWTLPKITSFQTSSCDGDFCTYVCGLPSEAIRFLDGLSTEDLHDVNIVLFHYWSTTRAFIQSVQPQSNTVTFKAHSYNPNNNPGPEANKALFYLENFKRALTKPGEWFLDRNGKLYYYPLSGETAENIEAYASHHKRLMFVRSHDIVFENIEFRYCGGNMPETGITRQDTFLFTSHKPWVIDVFQSQNIKFFNCRIRHCYGRGLAFYECENIEVSGCLVEDFGADGISFGKMKNSIITNNTLRHGGRFIHHENAIYDNYHPGGKITHNDISDMFWDGINVFGEDKDSTMVIEKNHVHHIGFNIFDDIGCIYVTNINGVVIQNNYVHDAGCHIYGAWGIYVDENCRKVMVKNNLAHDFYDGCFHLHYGWDNTVQNNILAYGELGVLSKGDNSGGTMVNIKNNILLTEKNHFFCDNWNDFTGSSNLFYDFGKNLQWIKGRDNDGNLGKVLDPLFTDPSKRIFTFTDTKNAVSIGFTPFDYSDCGVQGNNWREFAASYKIPAFPEKSTDDSELLKNEKMYPDYDHEEPKCDTGYQGTNCDTCIEGYGYSKNDNKVTCTKCESPLTSPGGTEKCQCPSNTPITGLNGNSCITEDTCKAITNAEVSGKSCVCSSGYSLNNEKTACVADTSESEYCIYKSNVEECSTACGAGKYVAYSAQSIKLDTDLLCIATPTNDFADPGKNIVINIGADTSLSVDSFKSSITFNVLPEKTLLLKNVKTVVENSEKLIIDSLSIVAQSSNDKKGNIIVVPIDNNNNNDNNNNDSSLSITQGHIDNPFGILLKQNLVLTLTNPIIVGCVFPTINILTFYDGYTKVQDKTNITITIVDYPIEQISMTDKNEYIDNNVNVKLYCTVKNHLDISNSQYVTIPTLIAMQENGVVTVYGASIIDESDGENVIIDKISISLKESTSISTAIFVSSEQPESEMATLSIKPGPINYPINLQVTHDLFLSLQALGISGKRVLPTILLDSSSVSNNYQIIIDRGIELTVTNVNEITETNQKLITIGKLSIKQNGILIVIPSESTKKLDIIVDKQDVPFHLQLASDVTLALKSSSIETSISPTVKLNWEEAANNYTITNGEGINLQIDNAAIKEFSGKTISIGDYIKIINNGKVLISLTNPYSITADLIQSNVQISSEATLKLMGVTSFSKPDSGNIVTISQYLTILITAFMKLEVTISNDLSIGTTQFGIPIFLEVPNQKKLTLTLADSETIKETLEYLNIGSLTINNLGSLTIIPGSELTIVNSGHSNNQDQQYYFTLTKSLQKLVLENPAKQSTAPILQVTTEVPDLTISLYNYPVSKVTQASGSKPITIKEKVSLICGPTYLSNEAVCTISQAESYDFQKLSSIPTSANMKIIILINTFESGAEQLKSSIKTLKNQYLHLQKANLQSLRILEQASQFILSEGSSYTITSESLAILEDNDGNSVLIQGIDSLTAEVTTRMVISSTLSSSVQDKSIINIEIPSSTNANIVLDDSLNMKSQSVVISGEGSLTLYYSPQIPLDTIKEFVKSSVQTINYKEGKMYQTICKEGSCDTCKSSLSGVIDELFTSKSYSTQNYTYQDSDSFVNGVEIVICSDSLVAIPLDLISISYVITVQTGAKLYLSKVESIDENDQNQVIVNDLLTINKNNNLIVIPDIETQKLSVSTKTIPFTLQLESNAEIISKSENNSPIITIDAASIKDSRSLMIGNKIVVSIIDVSTFNEANGFITINENLVISNSGSLSISISNDIEMKASISTKLGISLNSKTLTLKEVSSIDESSGNLYNIGSLSISNNGKLVIYPTNSLLNVVAGNKDLPFSLVISRNVSIKLNNPGNSVVPPTITVIATNKPYVIYYDYPKDKITDNNQNSFILYDGNSKVEPTTVAPASSESAVEPSETENDEEGGLKLPIIILIVCGAVIFVSLIIMVVCIVKRKRQALDDSKTFLTL